MNSDNEEIRYEKVLGAKILIERGFYHQVLGDIFDFILSGRTDTAHALVEHLDRLNKQIEQFEKSAKRRASFSFYTAFVAMFCGFAFIFWGGQHILRQMTWDHIAAGSAIASIGGSISAFIAKTFLKIHRLSIQELNRYSGLHVITGHVLRAQMIADKLSNSAARQKAYREIIACLLSLIQKQPSTTTPTH